MNFLRVAVFAMAGLAIAQDFRATLQGTVTDPTGASVGKAQVVLKNTDTGVDRTIETDGDGAYPHVWVGGELT